MKAQRNLCTLLVRLDTGAVTVKSSAGSHTALKVLAPLLGVCSKESKRAQCEGRAGLFRVPKFSFPVEAYWEAASHIRWIFLTKYPLLGVRLGPWICEEEKGEQQKAQVKASVWKVHHPRHCMVPFRNWSLSYVQRNVKCPTEVSGGGDAFSPWAMNYGSDNCFRRALQSWVAPLMGGVSA